MFMHIICIPTTLLVFIFLSRNTYFNMTTTISGITGTFYINNPPSDATINDPFTLKSQYSQEVIYTVSGYDVQEQNERYAKIVVPFPADFKDKHYNGYYTFCFGDLCDIVKIITQPGGDTGKVEYISSNEDRDAEVFYRPNY